MADESSGSEPELTDIRAAPGLAVARRAIPAQNLGVSDPSQKDFNGFNVWGFQLGQLRGW